MRALNIHHIGHAVNDLDAAIATYSELFGGRLEHRQTMPDQGVEAVTMLLGSDRVELLLPLGLDTPVGRFIDRRGPGMHHVALEVADLERALQDAAAAGAELIDLEPRPGLLGLRVAFIHPHSVDGVLVELVQLPERSEHG